jgi:hypothetical protein
MKPSETREIQEMLLRFTDALARKPTPGFALLVMHKDANRGIRVTMEASFYGREDLVAGAICLLEELQDNLAKLMPSDSRDDLLRRVQAALDALTLRKPLGAPVETTAGAIEIKFDA